MNVKLENIELLREHYCRKFYNEISMARKQFKPQGHICRNEDGPLVSNEQEILNRWVRQFNKLLKRRKDNECVTFTTTGHNRYPHY